MTNAERQKAHRDRMAEEGKKPWTRFVTAEEAFFLERVLMSLRENPGATPAMLRTKRGTLTPVDL